MRVPPEGVVPNARLRDLAKTLNRLPDTHRKWGNLIFGKIAASKTLAKADDPVIAAIRAGVGMIDSAGQNETAIQAALETLENKLSRTELGDDRSRSFVTHLAAAFRREAQDRGR